MYEQQINAYFDDPARRVQLVEAISRLVRIRSVREEPQPGMPFGPGPAAALSRAAGTAGLPCVGTAGWGAGRVKGTAELPPR